MILIVIAVGLLTGVYCLTVASFHWQDVVIGLVAACTLLFAFRSVLFRSVLPSNRAVLGAIVRFPLFVVVVIREIFTGTWLVTQFVLGLRKLEHPGIIAVPIGDRSRTAVGFSGLVLTLSPGSFLVDVDWERREMLVHIIDGANPDAVREAYERLYDRYERHIVP